MHIYIYIRTPDFFSLFKKNCASYNYIYARICLIEYKYHIHLIYLMPANLKYLYAYIMVLIHNYSIGDHYIGKIYALYM